MHALHRSLIHTGHTGIDRNIKTRLRFSQLCANGYRLAFLDEDFKICIGASHQRNIDFLRRLQIQYLSLVCH